MNIDAIAMERAEHIQRDFEARYADRGGVLGIGIGLNRAEDDLAINVQVASRMVAVEIPKSFHGMEVVVDVVEKIEAYRAAG